MPQTSPVYANLLAALDEALAQLSSEGLRRRLTSLHAVDGSTVSLNGRDVISWCSNDYLGLSTHPRLRASATEAMTRWGVGARASRLLAGTTQLHARLEAALAAWFGAEAALVYSSGYLANLGTLGALLASEDAVFIDRLCHASLLDAARATQARLRVFHHNDPSHLKHLLMRMGKVRRRVVVTEGIFSMDGDRAPLAELLDAAAAGGALLYLDDAHGAFVTGQTGRGSPEAASLTSHPFLYMGTLGKALGCQGGFVVGPRILIEWLTNTARTFIYSTALAVPMVAAALEALQVIEEEPWRLVTVQARARQLYHRLRQDKLVPSTDDGDLSHILPIVIGEDQATLKIAQALLERGMWAPAIRPPTVPKGTSRLRLSVTASHTEAQVDQLARLLTDLLPPR